MRPHPTIVHALHPEQLKPDPTSSLDTQSPRHKLLFHNSLLFFRCSDSSIHVLCLTLTCLGDFFGFSPHYCGHVVRSSHVQVRNAMSANPFSLFFLCLGIWTLLWSKLSTELVQAQFFYCLCVDRKVNIAFQRKRLPFRLSRANHHHIQSTHIQLKVYLASLTATKSVATACPMYLHRYAFVHFLLMSW